MDAFEYLRSLQHAGVKLGLETMYAVCEALGHPARAWRSIVVAGTNGKGSVTAMTARALQAEGRGVGRYTSPHLHDVTERIAVDGTPVPERELGEAVNAVRGAIEQLQQQGRLHVMPTFFEVTTAAGFHLFARAGVHTAVLEVGLGGRFDATNVVSPAAVAITSIGHDHQQYLGDTIEAIAFEKAGVIKPRIPAVSGVLPDAALTVVRARCAEVGASLHEISHEVQRERRPDGVMFRTPARSYRPARLALAGEHQVLNAAVAVRLLELLPEPPSAEAILTGLEQVHWPGRLEPLQGRRGALLFDAAHNAAGAEALAAYVRATHPEGLPFVFGVMRDKDIPAMLRALQPAATHLLATRAPSARSATPDEIEAAARGLWTSDRIAHFDSVGEAAATAWRWSPLVVVCGSIYLYAGAQAAVGQPVEIA